MHDKNVTATPYPAQFHVGFLVDSTEKVNHHHARIIEAGFDAPTPAIIKRGGSQDLRLLLPRPRRSPGRSQHPRRLTASVHLLKGVT